MEAGQSVADLRDGGGELTVGNASAIGTGTLMMSTGGAIRGDSSALTLTNPVAISGDATCSGTFDIVIDASVENGAITKAGAGSSPAPACKFTPRYWPKRARQNSAPRSAPAPRP